jgi:hypothetical protein
MVSVCGEAPATSVVGFRRETVGTGLLAVTVKVAGVDAPPPGVGFVTTTA